MSTSSISQHWALDPHLAQHGYRVEEQLVPAASLTVLHEAYDDIRAKRVDCGDDDRYLGGITHQVMFPAQHDARFATHPAISRAKALAKEWMGWTEPAIHFDMLICKPPQHPESTPWHQDAAYGAEPFVAAHETVQQRTLQFWLALDDVDETSGCMHFAPGVSLNRVMPHEVVGAYHGEESRLLQIIPHELSPQMPTVACPLKAGGCTVHSEGALHMTTPNTHKNRWRRAYIFNLSDAGGGYFAA